MTTHTAMKPLLLLTGLCLAALSAPAQDKPEALTSGSIAGAVVRVSLGDKELTDMRAWRGTRELIEKAVAARAGALLLEIHTTHTRAPTALIIAEEIARLKIRTLAFIPASALGGGALAALACDDIWMAPGARIGAVPPALPADEERSEAAEAAQMAEAAAVLKAGARSLCKLKGHRSDLAEAFIDRDKEFKVGGRSFSTKGELLILDADDAALVIDGTPLLSRGLAADTQAVVKHAGIMGRMLTLEERLFAQAEKKVEAVPEKNRTTSRTGPYTGKVVVIPVGEDDLITPARFEFMTRTLERCTEENAEAVIFDLDTPGGLAWDTTNLMMKDLQKLTPRSFAYVNPRALSAGAMIAIATDAIYMAPASSTGAATPVYSTGMEMGDAERAKMNSAIMSMARTVAKEKGHDFRVIEAMIDSDRELVVNGEVLCAKGEILTLDAEQAVLRVDGRPLFAKAIVRTLDEIKQAEGLKGSTITAEPTGFEQIAIWVTKYAAILILIGVAAGYLEMQTPGFGIPGFISLLAFGLFFFGHYVAGSLVGNEAAVVAGIFVLGVALLVVELIIFPGTLVPGITGFFFVMIALVYSMSGWDAALPPEAAPGSGAEGAWPAFDFNLATYATGLRNFALGVIGAGVLILVMIRYMPELRPFRRLVLDSAAGGTLETTPAMTSARSVKTGDEGIARSALRPCGTIEIAQRQMEATAEADYIQSGTRVRVREVQGSRIIVEPVV